MNIFEKLMNIQNELKAPKNQWNEFGKYKYRNCEDILEAVKPICKKYNMALIVEDEIVMIGERYYVRATATIYDCNTTENQSCLFATAYAREEESKKGMDGSQVTGASSSYARKYALNGLFNIDDTKDSDSTNTGESGKSGGEEPRKYESREQPPARNSTPQPTATPARNEQGGRMTVEEALNYSLRSGKHAGKKFRDVPIDYLKWCAENMSGTGKLAAQIVVNYAEKSSNGNNGQMSVYDDDGDNPF